MSFVLARLATALLVAGVCVSMRGAAPAPEPDVFETIQKNSADWISTRRETLRLEADWETERALLESTLAQLKHRVADAKEKRSYAEQNAAEQRTDLETLVAKKKTEEAELTEVARRLQALTAQLIALRPKLPPRLSDALEMPYRTLVSKQLGESERMQMVGTMLARMVQFNRMISVADEVITFEGETAPKSVETLYWGLTQGYAFDRATGDAWLGAAGAEKWEWRRHSEMANDLARLFAISRDKADPVYVPLLAQLKPADAATAKN